MMRGASLAQLRARAAGGLKVVTVGNRLAGVGTKGVNPSEETLLTNSAAESEWRVHALSRPSSARTLSASLKAKTKLTGTVW